MATKDPYSVLGLDSQCSDSQIVAMYRHLAKLNHPDRGGSAKLFCDIQAAYDLLSTSGKRAAYDRSPGRLQNFQVRTYTRRVREPYEAAYLRYKPDWDRDLREWLQHKNQQTPQQQMRPNTGTERKRRWRGRRVGSEDAQTIHRARNGIHVLWRRSIITAVIAGTTASILRWLQTGGIWAAGREDIAVTILGGGLRDPWVMFAAVAAGGVVAWAQILRVGRTPRLWRTGVCVATAAVVLVGAGSSLPAWLTAAWLLVGSAVATMNTKWGRDRIKNPRADAQ